MLDYDQAQPRFTTKVKHLENRQNPEPASLRFSYGSSFREHLRSQYID